MSSELKIVNIVGSGDLSIEIGLNVLADRLNVEKIFMRRGGLYFRFSSDSPTVIVARTGKYIITGG